MQVVVICNLNLSSQFLNIWKHMKPPEVCYKKSILKYLVKFIGKHLYQNLFFKKVAGLKSVILLKKRLWHRCFYVNFCEIFKNIFFTEHLRATAYAIRMQIAVIYNSNPSFQFVTINFTFSLMWVFTLAHSSMLPEFLQRFVFRWGYF